MSWLAASGDVAVALLLGAENVGLPLPGETALVATAVLGARHPGTLTTLAVIAFAVSVAGAAGGYEIGGRWGRAWLLRRRRWRVTPERLARAERLLLARGGAVVLVARFVPVLRQLHAPVAGIAGMPRPRFLVLTTVGAALRVSYLVTAAALLGSHLPSLADLLP